MYPLLHSSWTVESDLYIQTFTVCICQFIIPFWEDPNAFHASFLISWWAKIWTFRRRDKLKKPHYFHIFKGIERISA